MKELKKYWQSGVYVLIAILVFGSVWEQLKVKKAEGPDLIVEMDIRALCTDSMQVFFDPNEQGFFEENSAWATYAPDLEVQTLQFPIEHATVHGLRIDPRTSAGPIEIHGLRVLAAYDRIEMAPEAIDSLFEFNSSCVAELDTTGSLRIVSTGIDPYFSSRNDLGPIIKTLTVKKRPVLWPFLVSLLTALVTFIILVRTRPIELLAILARNYDRGLKFIFRPKFLLAILLAGATYWLVLVGSDNIRFHDVPVKLVLSGTFEQSDDLQVYYALEEKDWQADDHLAAKVYGSQDHQLIEFPVTRDLILHYIRIDLGTQQTCVLIDSLSIHTPYLHHTWYPKDLVKDLKENTHVSDMEVRNGRLEVNIIGDDANLRSLFNLSYTQADIVDLSSRSRYPKYFALTIALFVLILFMSVDQGDLVPERSERWKWAASITFCGLIMLPLLSRMLPIEPKGHDTEKRKLAKRPVLEARNLLTYPDRYSSYYDDSFGFRRTLIRWNALVKGAGMGVSPKKGLVIFGKEDWMFYMAEGVVDHYRHATLFTEEELNTIQRKLENRHQWLKEQGMSYYVTIPPLKGTVYPEYLPDKFNKINPKSKLDQLVEHMAANSHVQIIDMRPALLEKKKERQIYYKSDTHWNLIGAFTGYQVLIKAIAKDHPEIVPYDRDQFKESEEWKDHADLTMLIGLNDVFPRKKYMLHPIKKFRADESIDRDYDINQFFKYRPYFDLNDSLQGPNMVMFRDSYAVYLKPFLSEHFHNSTYIWTPLFHPEVIEKEKPDIVIHEVLERFIDDLKLDDPGDPKYDQ